MHIDSLAILERLARHFRLKNSGSAVAQFLEVSSPQVVYNWRDRNNIDLNLILPKARQTDPLLSLDWLIYGEGTPHRQPEHELQLPQELESGKDINTVTITENVFTLEDFVAFIQEKRKRSGNTPDSRRPS